MPKWPSSNNTIVPRIEYTLTGSSKKCRHVYFRSPVFWVILLFCWIVLLFDINVVMILLWWPDVTIVQSHVTIVVPWQQSTGSIHDHLFCYCPLVGILFEVLRISSMSNFCKTETTFSCNLYYWAGSINHDFDIYVS